MKRLYCRCDMSQLDNFRFLIYVISTLQTFYPQVCQSNFRRTSAFCHKLCKKINKKKKRTQVHIPNCWSLVRGKMPISALIRFLQIGWGHPYYKPCVHTKKKYFRHFLRRFPNVYKSAAGETPHISIDILSCTLRADLQTYKNPQRERMLVVHIFSTSTRPFQSIVMLRSG